MANTSAPCRSTSAAATSSCVDSGFDAHRATSAPPASSVRTSPAVSAVTWRHAPTTRPSSGRSRSKRSRTCRRTGICSSAHSIRAWPASLRPGSATSEWEVFAMDLVPVVLGLVGAFHRHADVGRLLLGELGELHAERIEVEPGHLLVELLREHVHLLLVLVRLVEELDLGDRLIRERVRHHEARVPGGVAQVQQPAL